jgi:purine-binding chemotaxis protein CheW
MTAVNTAGNQTDTDSDELQLVSFLLGAEEYGLDILLVQEIIRMTNITGVPQVPDFVEGVINLRGRVIPVIDLRKRFGLPAHASSHDSRIVVVSADHDTIGLIVDAVSEVVRVPSEALEPPPDLLAGTATEFVRGMAKLDDRLIMHLDVARVIAGRGMKMPQVS